MEPIRDRLLRALLYEIFGSELRVGLMRPTLSRNFECPDFDGFFMEDISSTDLNEVSVEELLRFGFQRFRQTSLILIPPWVFKYFKNEEHFCDTEGQTVALSDAMRYSPNTLSNVGVGFIHPVLRDAGQYSFGR